MNSRQARWPSRHRRTMELLAQARPDRLDSSGLTAAGWMATVQNPNFPAIAPGSPTEQPRRRDLRVHRRHAVLGAAAALVAGATAVGVLAAVGSTPAPVPVAMPARAAALTARQILLTAAVSAARQPAAGRYWRVQDVSATVTAAGPNARPYAVEQRWGPSLTWDARSSSQRTWTFPSTGYRSVPASTGAAAAWRADGSPRLPASRSAQQAWWQTGGAVGYLGNGNLTFAQFQRLPSSPTGLAAVVRKAAQQQIAPPPARGADVHTWGVGTGQNQLAQAMFGVYDQLLKLDPISPAVRAAVFRDLARLPGVRSIGKVVDPLGRTGYGIAQGGAPGSSEEVLVIAPGTGLLLSDEYVTVSSAHQAPLPSSGALPGLARCPKGVQTVKHMARQGGGHVVCMMTAAQAKHLPAGDGTVVNNGQVLVGTGPVLQLAPGQLQYYDAIVSAGWTNTSPPLPPRAQQFSVAKDGKG